MITDAYQLRTNRGAKDSALKLTRRFNPLIINEMEGFYFYMFKF